MALIPQAIYENYIKYTESMINELGVSCVVVYPPVKINCENCYFNTMPGLGGTNVYRPGGPYPFTSGLCPYCYGKGFKEDKQTENIKIRAYFDKKSWVKMNVPIGIADNGVMTIGFMADLAKIKRCQSIIIPAELSLTERFEYTLLGEPIPWGLKRDAYFVAFFNRFNNG